MDSMNDVWPPLKFLSLSLPPHSKPESIELSRLFGLIERNAEIGNLKMFNADCFRCVLECLIKRRIPYD